MWRREWSRYSHCCQAGWGGVECVGVHYIVRAMYRCRDSSSTRPQEPENSTLQESMHTVQGSWWKNLVVEAQNEAGTGIVFVIW